jgi:cellulose synthase/poly-beta-1,6-N-acetylglucosamine synthase-like glycosyltransferase
MGEVLTLVILPLYYLVLGVLAIFGLHRAYLVVVYLRSRGNPRPEPPPPEAWPRVTVQLPLYNEMYVARRLIDAVARLDYPADRLEIQVLDDSTDETTEIVADTVARHRRRGLPIEHVRREDRSGFKAGALEAGLVLADEKAEDGDDHLIAVFDADFVPGPDFLRRTVPHFNNPRVGMVQARWEHLNRGYSLLTRIQAVLLDGHFWIEHAARERSGCFFNFNGTAGVWRRRAIADAGGWQHDTLTEDLDLSYRAQLAGWKFLYLPDLAAPAELPVDIHGFKGQQHRWAKGSAQTGRKLLARVLKAPLPLRVKAEALVHLTANGSYLLMVLLSLMVFPAMLLRRGEEPNLLLWLDLLLFFAATGSVLLFYVISQRARGESWWTGLKYLPALMGLGIGLSINNARAVIGGLLHSGGTFHRTPKYQIEEGGSAQGQDWKAKKYRAGKSLTFVLEGLFALYLAVCSTLAVTLEMWWSLPFLYLFFYGYTYMFTLSVILGAEGPRPTRTVPAS